MENSSSSSSYLALEAMLRQGWVFMSFAELERALDVLEKKALISPAEHNALTEHAKNLGLDQRSSG
ncbi:MAG TPA: hypothetical protein VKB04_08975 [Anaerolineales bacterium]|nr:hypothetical protein [Anaerolineales bacterium]